MFNRIYLQLKTDLPQILNCQTKLHFFFNSIINKLCAYLKIKRTDIICG